MHKSGNKNGFSLIELLTAMGIIAIVATVSFATLFGSQHKANFEQVRVRISTLLSDAQSRSVNQERGSAWGVHFESTSTGSFYALFYGSYSGASVKSQFSLPSDLRFATSSLPAGSSKEIMFKTVSGAASSSNSISIQLLAAPFTSSTITVSTSGVVSF